MSVLLSRDAAIFNRSENGGESIILSVEEQTEDEELDELSSVCRVIKITAHSYGSSESSISVYTFDSKGLDDVIGVLMRLRDKMEK